MTLPERPLLVGPRGWRRVDLRIEPRVTQPPMARRVVSRHVLRPVARNDQAEEQQDRERDAQPHRRRVIARVPTRRGRTGNGARRPRRLMRDRMRRTTPSAAMIRFNV